MKKYLMLIIILGSLIFISNKFIKTNAYEEVNYEYKIIASDNSLESLLNLYEEKEKFIILYNNALNNEENILEVYKSFTNEKIELIDEVFIITIGKGEGISLEGKLRTSVCDNNTINERYALLDWLVSLKK